MLSIMSALKIGKADKVYIHTNYPPTGMYWDKIKKDPRSGLTYVLPNKLKCCLRKSGISLS